MALPGDYRTETKPKEASSRTERKQADRTLFRSGTRAFFAAWLPPGSQPSSTGTLSRRWFSLSCALFACYVLLDRSTLYLQMWHDISAWYPPTGLAFALFIGLGFGAFPPLLLAGFVTGLVNYHQSVGSAEFWLLNPVVPIIYLVAARQLKKRLPGNLRIHSMRDLLYLLGIAAVASFSAAGG